MALAAMYGSEVQGDEGGKTFTWLGGWGYRQTGVEWSSVYVRARHYSRGLSNWTSVNPLWPSEMAYGYVEGRVMTGVDPSGMAMPLPQIYPAGIPNGWQVVPGGPSAGAPNLTVVPGGAGATAGVSAGGVAVGACSIVVIAWACYEICSYRLNKPCGPLTTIGDILGKGLTNSALGNMLWPQELPADPWVVQYQTRRRIECARNNQNNSWPWLDPTHDFYPLQTPKNKLKYHPRCPQLPPCPNLVRIDPPQARGHFGTWQNGSVGRCFSTHTHLRAQTKYPPLCKCTPAGPEFEGDCFGPVFPA